MAVVFLPSLCSDGFELDERVTAVHRLAAEVFDISGHRDVGDRGKNANRVR